MLTQEYLIGYDQVTSTIVYAVAIYVMGVEKANKQSIHLLLQCPFARGAKQPCFLCCMVGVLNEKGKIRRDRQSKKSLFTWASRFGTFGK